MTGASGFAAPFVAEALKRILGTRAEIILSARLASTTGRDGEGPGLRPLDITDADAVSALLAELKPTHVVHLAGVAAHGEAARDPYNAWKVNVFGTLNIARAMRREVPKATLVFAGSGLAYGLSAKGGPLDEMAILAPVDDYGATKAAADLMLGAHASQGLKVIRFRCFNHTGPKQTDDYVVPALARQIAELEAGHAPPVLKVGNLDAERDFLDVRDVAAAYAAAVIKSDGIESGTIFNIASGVPRRIGEILNTLLAASSCPITVEQDPMRMRPSDIPSVVGNPERARRQLEWQPVVPFETTLRDVLGYWRKKLRPS